MVETDASNENMYEREGAVSYLSVVPIKRMKNRSSPVEQSAPTGLFSSRRTAAVLTMFEWKWKKRRPAYRPQSLKFQVLLQYRFNFLFALVLQPYSRG